MTALERHSRLREVCFLLNHDAHLVWSDVSGEPHALADSRPRWEAIWQYRDELAEIAHTHPHGPPQFSSEDESTMAAIESALGKPLHFSVVTPDSVLIRVAGEDRILETEPWWVPLIRRASGL